MNRKLCEGCLLKGLARPYEIDRGRGVPRFLVVTPTPSKANDEQDRIMSIGAMKVFSDAMRKERFSSHDFAFIPQIRCSHDPDNLTAREKTAIQNHCRVHLVEEIKSMRPEVIIPLGADATKQTLGRAVQISKVKGIAERLQEFRTLCLPMLNPGQVVLYPQHGPEFAADCATLGRLVDHNYNIQNASKSVTGDYEYIEDLEFLIRQKPTLIAFDTEGSGLTMEGSDNLRWYSPTAKLLTMQFCIEPGKAYMLPWDHKDSRFTARQKNRLKQQFIQLCCNEEVTVVGQNLKFDALMLYGQLGINLKIGGDTLLLAALLDENALTKNLDDLVKRYVPEMAGYADRFNATVDKSKMDLLPLDDKFLDYGCGDADAAFRVHSVLHPMVAADELLYSHYIHVDLPGNNAFRAIETRGMFIDENEIASFEEAMQEKVKASYASLLRQVPRDIKKAHVDKGLRFTRPEFVRDILFRHPKGFRLEPVVFTKGTAKLKDEKRKVPSVSSKDHLPFFYEQCPFTLELAQYIKDERLLNTNVIGFRNKYVVDGMARSQYRQDVAVTGRTASEDPNGQNYPNRGPVAKAYRRMFIAPEDCYILAADLSQAELRISADMANDRTMIQIYANNGDIHIETALIAMNITMVQFLQLSEKDQKDARTKAKAINFGFIYGMGWRKFVAYAFTQYGVRFTDAEAQRIRSAFFDKYSALPEWHARMREIARHYKQVRSYSGRVRHLPMIDSAEEYIRQEAERQAINSPVQNFGSDLGVMALSRLEEEIDSDYLAVVAFVHDAIYCYVPREYLEWGAKTLKYYMESNPLLDWFDLKMNVPIIADVAFGLNLGEMEELKGLTTAPRTVRARVASRYDFSRFWDDEKREGILVPRQLTPPNQGRRLVSPYTLAA